MPKHCPSCGAGSSDGAKFCHRCGQPLAASGGAAPLSAPGAAAPVGVQQVMPWIVAAIALLCLLAFIVGQNWRRTQPAPTAVAPAAAPAGALGGAPGRAVDISQMTPDERADRLFNRVMTYVTEGKSDSVQFFAPMAIQSFEALAPLNAHRRYDLGLLGVVSGDGALARAQADTILSTEPRHLLGLILGMRAAGLQLDSLARRQYVDRFSTALGSERARRLPEYVDHEPDIDAAVRDIDSKRTPTAPAQRRP